VQHASEIRRGELREDYPWVDVLLEPLKGRVVPIAFEEIVAAWNEQNVLEKLQRESTEGRLPPAHIEEGVGGLRQDLEDLGIFLRMKDGRVNIPDVFRVAYGLGRKGGVRPLRRMITIMISTYTFHWASQAFFQRAYPSPRFRMDQKCNSKD